MASVSGVHTPITSRRRPRRRITSGIWHSTPWASRTPELNRGSTSRPSHERRRPVRLHVLGEGVLIFSLVQLGLGGLFSCLTASPSTTSSLKALARLVMQLTRGCGKNLAAALSWSDLGNTFLDISRPLVGAQSASSTQNCSAKRWVD